MGCVVLYCVVLYGVELSWAGLCCVILCCVVLCWMGLDCISRVRSKIRPNCTSSVAFNIHLFVFADPQWLHNDQVLCSKREVGHHKQRITLTAWIPAPRTLPPAPSLHWLRLQKVSERGREESQGQGVENKKAPGREKGVGRWAVCRPQRILRECENPDSWESCDLLICFP